MGDGNLSYEDLLQILKLVESSSQFAEFRLKVGDIEIDLRKTPVLPASCGQEPPSNTSKTLSSTPEVEGKGPFTSGAYPSAGEASADSFPEGVILIKSPMVGTFYRSPEPGASPFVEVDQWVAPETTVCIIEVMKLMNSLKAGHAGIVTHILVNDGEPVEFGQVLMVIEPNGNSKE